jgi:hypothetical protein
VSLCSRCRWGTGKNHRCFHPSGTRDSLRIERCKHFEPKPDSVPEPFMLSIVRAGHGLTDISCCHGSRCIWWPGPYDKGKWMCVVRASSCDCGEPPRPFRKGIVGPVKGQQTL